jgi:hypothetical protein
MRTEVCITIDIEFSIGGNFTDPSRYHPVGARAVDCVVRGREEGLGFLLEKLARYEINATCFVEALQTSYFGDEPMGQIARRVAANGHDVQLHIHPCWLHYRGERADTAGQNDSCAGRSDGELDNLIAAGIGAFSTWGLPKPIALRTGNLQTDRSVYRAMTRAGIPLGSNIGRAIYRATEPELRISGGRHRIENVLELPVLGYRGLRIGPWQRWQNLTISGSSWPEIFSLLWQARRQNISPVVLLTHPFDFVKKKDPQYLNLRRDRVNQGRMLKLLRFLRQYDQDFVGVSFAAQKASWLAADTTSDPSLAVSRLATAARMLHNAVNDHVWHY